MPRHKPFSSKKKKAHDEAKREQRRGYYERKRQLQATESVAAGTNEKSLDDAAAAHKEPLLKPQAAHGRYRLQVAAESKEVVEQRKKDAQKPLQRLPYKAMEVSLDEFFRPGTALDMPKRPPWSYSDSKEKVLANEEEVFRQYVAKLRAEFKDEELSYFELNLETWRQLWRVLEISDIICLIMDVRYAAMHFPPPLFDYVVKEQGKKVFLILNKCDLVGEPTTTAWKEYFEARFPGIEVFTFASFRTATTGNPASRRKNQRLLTVPLGLLQLVRRWEELGLPGAESWKRKLRQRGMDGLLVQGATGVEQVGKKKKSRRGQGKGKGAGKEAEEEEEEEEEEDEEEGGGEEEEVEGEDEEGEADEDEDAEEEEDEEDAEEEPDDEEASDQDPSQPEPQASAKSRRPHRHRKTEEETATAGAGSEADPTVEQHPRDVPQERERSAGPAAKKFITLGMVGQPNVGKSTIINSIVGKIVVSASPTPGHTKYFQTFFLTDEIRLCDCPGLIFPSLTPRPLQILSGLFPVSQVREPYTAMRYLGERVDLVSILHLPPPEDGEPWTPWRICESWAVQRSYLTGRAGRPDVYRAANDILRHCVAGRIVLSFKPPGYYDKYGEAAFNVGVPVQGLEEAQLAEQVRKMKMSRYVVLRSRQTAPGLMNDMDEDLDFIQLARQKHAAHQKEQESVKRAEEGQESEKEEEEEAGGGGKARGGNATNKFALLGDDADDDD